MESCEQVMQTSDDNSVAAYDFVAVLPPELSFYTFSFLDPTHLASAAIVSRSWHDVTRDTNFWMRSVDATFPFLKHSGCLGGFAGSLEVADLEQWRSFFVFLKHSSLTFWNPSESNESEISRFQTLYDDVLDTIVRRVDTNFISYCIFLNHNHNGLFSSIALTALKYRQLSILKLLCNSNCHIHSFVLEKIATEFPVEFPSCPLTIECRTRSLSARIPKCVKYLSGSDFKAYTTDLSSVSINETPDFPDLETLDLDKFLVMKIADIAKSFPKLTRLGLRNRVWNQSLAPISTMCQLRELDLSYNMRICSLPDSFSCLNSLEFLDLKWCGFLTIPSVIYKLPSLKELDLSGNDIESSIEPLACIKSLRILRLRFCSQVPETIFPQLEVLDLSVNSTFSMSRGLGDFRSLRSIRLSHCGLEEFPSVLSNLSQLQSLDLGNNKIKELPTSISNLSFLRALCLEGNSLSKLPNSLGGLRHLQLLELRNNLLVDLPSTFGNLYSLQVLDVSHRGRNVESDRISKTLILLVIALFANGRLPSLDKLFCGPHPFRLESSMSALRGDVDFSSCVVSMESFSVDDVVDSSDVEI